MTIKLISAFALAFLFATAFGRFYIPWLRRQKAGQQIKEIGPNWHMSKSGTPTMGGVMFILAVAFVCLTIYLILHQAAWYSYLFVVLFLLFLKDLIAIKKTKPELLDPFLGRQVKHSFLLVWVYGILLLV